MTRLLITLMLVAAAGRPAYAGAVVAVSPQAAIEAAVRERLGVPDGVVAVDVRTAVAARRGLAAEPDPAARLGAPSRYVLTAPCREATAAEGCRERLGTATAIVRVTAEHVRATRTIARGEALSPDVVEVVRGELPSSTIRRLPDPASLTGVIARRQIAAGEMVTDAVVIVPPLVSAGASLALTVVVGRVRATGVGVAASSGHAGDVITIMPTATRRALRARITGPGAAEVLQ